MNKLHYVTTSGDDKAAGTSETTAWRTIGAAIPRIAAGDTILIGPGTYHEAVNLNVQGATIAALDPEQRPTIDGKYALPAGELQRANIDLPDGKKTTGFVWGALVDITASDATIRGIDCRNSRGRGLRITNGASNALFSHMKMTGSRSHGFIVDGATYSGIEDSEVADVCNYATSWRQPAVALYPKGSILIRAKHCFIRSSHFHHFYGGALGTLDAEDCEVAGNTVHDVWRSGINFTLSTRCKAWGNHLYQRDQAWLGRAFSGLLFLPEKDYPGGSNVDCAMHSNIVVDFDGAASIGHEPTVKNTRCSMRYNTFVVRRKESVVSFRKDNKTFEFSNNIVVGRNKATVEATAEFIKSGPTFADNLWFGVEPPAGIQGTGYLNANPQLVDVDGDAAVKENFYLTATSPARGRASGDVPPTDITGRKRTGKDVGAHEFVGEVEPPVEPPVDPPPTGDTDKRLAALEMQVASLESLQDVMRAEWDGFMDRVRMLPPQ